MKKTVRILGVLVALALVAVLAGCASAPKADSGAMKVGIRASATDASLTVEDQPGATNELRVAAVKAPEAAWLVVHLDDGGKPGKRIGLLGIPKGASAELAVPLSAEATLTPKLIVAVHADRATPGTFDFVMDKFDASPDKPYRVDGKELATFINVN